MVVFRPADANEVTEGWRVAIGRRHGPTTLVFSRQALPIFDRTKFAPATGARRGAYVLADAPHGQPDVILLASGSEVSLIVDAREMLQAEGHRVRVVSMPSWELFAAQPQSYRDEVLPPGVTARVGVEAASPLGWERWVGRGDVIGLDRFGASAPYTDIYTHLNFTPEYIAQCARDLLDGGKRDGAGVPNGSRSADRASLSQAASDDRD
jgi:transketolase